MPDIKPSTSGEITPPPPYGADYYLDASGQPQGTFNFIPERDVHRAQAIADAAGVPAGGRILDFGCGLGTMTVAFNSLGYQAVGVDPSPDAIKNALPQARGLVRQLDHTGLSNFPNDSVDLVLAKDVFEHIDERRLHDLADELICIGGKVLAIIPVVDEDRRFIFDLYERDKTHITRLTRNEWLGFFPHSDVTDCKELTPKVRRADKVVGTLCLLLEETDMQWRQVLMDARNELHSPRQRLLKRAANLLLSAKG